MNFSCIIILKAWHKLVAISSILFLPTLLVAQTPPTTFTYTGGTQTFTVPAGVTTLTLTAVGGGGGGGGSDIAIGITVIGGTGGAGASSTKTQALSPGDVLTIIVGGGGTKGSNTVASTTPGGAGGWGNTTYDGGTGGVTGSVFSAGAGGGGGGASAIILNGSAVLVAAGGGGGGGGQLSAILTQSPGGAGGGGGVNGSQGANSGGAGGATGASGSSTGVAGAVTNAIDRGGAGGGGGGVNGGDKGTYASAGSKGSGGGGGGSSSGTVTNGGVGAANATNGANGSVTISWTVLPVEIIDFRVQSKTQHIELIWSTATEKNNHYFDIEKSDDGSLFYKIGQVKSEAAGGNSNSVLNYSFVDNSISHQVNYYRLRQVDFNGKFEYSKTIAYTNESISGNDFNFDIIPNPTNGLEFNINFSNQVYEAIDLKLRNILGEEIYTCSLSSITNDNTYTFNLFTKLPSGIYFISLTNHLKTITKKIVVE